MACIPHSLTILILVSLDEIVSKHILVLHQIIVKHLQQGSMVFPGARLCGAGCARSFLARGSHCRLELVKGEQPITILVGTGKVS